MAVATSFTGVMVSSFDANFSFHLAFGPLSSVPGLKIDTVGNPSAFTASSAYATPCACLTCHAGEDHVHLYCLL